MSKVFIKALPLNAKDRADLIKEANKFFEDIFEAIEPRSPEETRKLWDVEEYVDNFLHVNMLPIEREYAISMMETFLVRHIADLAAEADRIKGVAPMPAKELDATFAASGKHGLRCGIIIDNDGGNTHEEILATTAEALRVLATQIETGRLKVGLHPVSTPDGKTIGEIHLEQYETLTGGGVTVARSKKTG